MFRARSYIEPAVCFFHRAGRRKRTEGFALLDHGVDPVTHFGMPRIGEDTPITQCPRTVLHAATIPCDDPSISNKFSRGYTGSFKRIEALPFNLVREAVKCGFNIAR